MARLAPPDPAAAWGVVSGIAAGHCVTLLARLGRHIESSGGAIPFEDFMRWALYDPEGGFFATGPLRSDKEGDFLTSPEVSPMFGEMLAVFVTHEWERLGRPDGFVVVDAGAGSGSLLEPLLAALDVPVAAYAVEVSAAAREVLAARLPEVTLVGDLDELPPRFEGVILANELLDNLPMAVVVRTPDAWSERWVGISERGLELVEAPVRPDVSAWAERWSGPVPDGGMVEVQMEATGWVAQALDRLGRGALVTLDYGDTAQNLEPRRVEGTIRTYRGHHLGPHPLDAPGDTDITADVNFSAIHDAAEEAGATAEVVRQDDFLTDLGLRERLRTLRDRELELAREGDPIERLRVRTRLQAGDTLLHPRGLGDFRVLIARK